MSSNKLAIVVLGMHRSGTSAMTRVVGLSGFTLPRNLMPPQPDNPSGFWESRTLSQVNDDILARLGSSWDDIFAANEQALGADDREALETTAVAALEAEFGDASRIVVKDPRVCLLSDFWKRVLTRSGYAVNFVVTVRDPLEVAASLAVRDGFVRDKSLMLWLQYMLAAERKTRADPRAFVAFEDLLVRPDAVLERLDATLPGALAPRSAADMGTIDRFVTATLRHHTNAHGFSDRALDQRAQSVFEALLATARGGALDTSTLDEASVELARLGDMVGVVHADLDRHAREVGQIYVDMQAREAQAKSALASFVDERVSLAARLVDMEHELDVVGQLRSDRLAAEERLTSHEAELVTLSGERDALAAQLVDLERELNSVSQLQAELGERAKAAKLAADIADRERCAIGAAMATFQTDRQELLANLEALTATQAAALEALERRASLAEEAAAVARLEVQCLSSEGQTLKEARLEAVAAADSRAEEVRVLLGRATALADALGRSRSEERALNARLIEADLALQRLSNERNEMSAAIDLHNARFAYIQSRWWWRLLVRAKRIAGRLPVNDAASATLEGKP